MGGRFDAVMVELDKKADKSELIAIKAEIAGVKGEVSGIIEKIAEEKKNEILGVLDAHAKRSDDRAQEHDMLVGQVGRHERWITKIAKKTKVKLDS